MKKKSWFFIILVVILIGGYFKFFFKIWPDKVVPKSADAVVAIDVKRIINTSIWNWITTPSQWHFKDLFKSGKKEISWMDMVEIPDYVLAFHIKNQPSGIWYLNLQIKNENDFQKGIQFYQFKKINENQFLDTAKGIRFLRNGNSILLTNNRDENNHYLSEAASVIFSKKELLNRENLNQLARAGSHLAMEIRDSEFLQKNAIITANFEKNKIVFDGHFSPKNAIVFPENSFAYNPGEICYFGNSQPPAAVLNLLSPADKNKFSTLMGIHFDSFFLASNKNYNFSFAGMQTRIDSAVTYTYDDNFNKVANVVVNKIQEPVYSFSIFGDSVSSIFQNWIDNKKVLVSDTGNIFTPMPLVKSYCNLRGPGKLNICSYNYPAENNIQSFNGVLFLNLNLDKMPAELLKLLPDEYKKAIENLKLIQVSANHEEDGILLKGIIQKKENDLPIIKF